MMEQVRKEDVRSSYKRRNDHNIEIGKYDVSVLEYMYEKEFLNEHNIQITDYLLDVPIKFFDNGDIKSDDAIVYVLRNDKKIIIYVGSSQGILRKSRIKCHNHRNMTSIVDIFLVKSHDKATILEDILIRDFKPELNRLINMAL